ncbi:DUF2207 domain-containing protein [Streptomyces sp. NPDC050738]|uniref:DUF2207 domain-containing protein n=1 Tax=Streptomyces sp. NPDC050738 TaxID=3154744 RepID=UPI003417E316
MSGGSGDTAADVARRRRRGTTMVVVLVAVLTLGGVASLGAVMSAWVASSEHVARLWTEAALAADGRARITEVIDYDFGNENRHGILRDVPGLAAEAEVSVTMGGKRVPYQVEPDMGDDGETRIRIGDADRTVTGRHRYRIQYELDGIAPGGKLAWNAVGTGWQVPLDHVEIHVTGPYEFGGIRCAGGARASREPCQVGRPLPGHLTLAIDNLKAGRGATLYAVSAGQLATAPPPPVEPSGPVIAVHRPGSLRVGLLTAGIALAAALVAGWLVRRTGREMIYADALPGSTAGPAGAVRRIDISRLPALATETAAPPKELTPALGGVLLTGDTRTRHKAAWLLSAVDDGYLVVDMEDNETFPTLTRPSREEVPRSDSTVGEVLDRAFVGRDSLVLGGPYDRLFANAWSRIGTQLIVWRNSSDLWDAKAHKRWNRVGLAGALTFLAGLITVIVTAIAAGRPADYWAVLLPIAAAVAGAGAGIFAGTDEVPMLTPQGTELWLRVEGFRRYLAGAGAQHVDAAAHAGVLDHYTAWAVALGVSDHWSQAVSESTVPPPVPSATRPARMPLVRPLMALAILDAVSSNTGQVPPSRSAASSSGSRTDSGSDTRYSVGGGGGGGGGGSW